MNRSKRIGKWDITNHAVVRCKQRVGDPLVNNRTATEIRRMISHSLSDVNFSRVIETRRDIYYPISFHYKKHHFGPYYCVARSSEPSTILTLLGEEEFSKLRYNRGTN
ncbi:hypothetical protein COU56_04855 [Candidatus Pacearchaeota archaeon CG10_big_fil_rev_8_21_14_0_10_31_9]|nr:MAG: hypothetical protein AUJ62_00345 [Candidatus Pacearchaeota archaeon CG1_02_32_21]PIN91663.1 MAG: hypothetical protein COU56_04855 [Candidatus Pacearchaeota archaeon CG10_big_fil_rev_8_21_14_0_10_31_9]PIZ83034.1 MAG: hypothetical protein COX97_01850 [Candidatus Pacearchaeota archaeon CG_4_10_14_0_2_um_filter_05_32_18]